MLRDSTKVVLTLLALLAIGGSQRASGFSMLGPTGPLTSAIIPAGEADRWQIVRIGYNLPGDIGGPLNLGEEYRWNIPVITYAFEKAFLDYFGASGVAAIESGIAFLNALPTYSSMSSNLTEFPLDTARVHFQAQALGLVDLKSTAMNLLLEEVGLTDSQRYTWTLRGFTNFTIATVDFTNYNVFQRNFDPVTLVPSAFVNGTLFTYQIREFAVPRYSDAVEVAADPDAFQNTPVTSQFNFAIPGVFFNGLTRDDIGGLRYLYRTNNLNVEFVESNVNLCFTNRTAPQFPFQVVSTGLTYFSLVAQTSTPAQMLAQFPGLQFTFTNSYITNVATQQVTAVFTNDPFQPLISAPTLLLITNTGTNFFQFFEYQFANVVTNSFSPTSVGQLRLSEFLADPFAPFLSTNLINRITTSEFVTNIPSGDIFIVPTNLCGYDIVARLFGTIRTNTNTIFSAIGSNFNNGFTNQLDLLLFSTNYFYLAFPIERDNNLARLRRGVDKLTFQRVDFDSVLGTTFTPITNEFPLFSVVGGGTNVVSNLVQSARRVISEPDIIFTAEDLNDFPDGSPTLALRTVTSGWTNHTLLNSSNVFLAGPGVIRQRPIVISFNKAGPTFFNTTPDFLDQTTAFLYFRWGSYDGTTNPPIVYPVGSSIQALEAQVLGP